MKRIILVSLLIIVIVSCNKETKYSNIPKISFKNLSHSIVKAGGDSIIKIRFDFEDGDGNIGFGTNNLYLIDSRTGDTTPYMIPVIPDKFDPSNGLKGIIQVEYEAAFLLLRTDTLHKKRDTLSWNIFMKDKADNASNTITTSDLILVDSL